MGPPLGVSTFVQLHKQESNVSSARTRADQARTGRVRTGMGGWNYAPWRETFYPADVPKNAELQYASRQVTAIEVNGTFYRLQKPAVFAKWRDETLDDFVFAIKAPRFIVSRRVLGEAKDGISRFIDSGLSQLGAKLGPILWQLPPTKRFDSQDLQSFLQLLPRELDGRRLRHALEVRHESFMTADFLALARQHQVAAVFADTDKYPSFADVTADFVYGRLMRTVSSQATGYSKSALKTWAQRARTWAQGGEPKGLPRIQAGKAAVSVPRDVFLFFISGAKERAPVAARHLVSLMEEKPMRKTIAAKKSAPRRKSSK